MRADGRGGSVRGYRVGVPWCHAPRALSCGPAASTPFPVILRERSERQDLIRVPVPGGKQRGSRSWRCALLALRSLGGALSSRCALLALRSLGVALSWRCALLALRSLGVALSWRC